MKESIYTIKKRYDDELILFNTRTKKIIKINEQEYNDLLLSNSCTYLYEEGFWVENNRNEFKDFLFDYKMSLYNSKYMTITYLITNQCNFRCVYCYEGEQLKNKFEKIMTPKEFEKIFDAILQESSARIVDLNFFGGEPLMAFQNVVDVLKILRSKEGVEVVANIVTNGYLLNKEKIRILKEAGIKSFQVTVDGPKKVHNQYRMLKNGKGTFDRILENIIYILDEDIELTINMNYCNENYKEIVEMLKKFPEKIKRKAYIKFNQLQSTINNKYVLNVEKKDINILSCFLQTMKAEGYPDLEYEFLEAGPCVAQLKNSIIIEANGKISKCIYGVGNEKFVLGNALQDINCIKSAIRGEKLDFLGKERECCQCCYLPLCKGGCKRKCVEQEVDNEMLICEKQKYEFLTDAILNYYI